jgi:co-chaperonin GroES (HSP10)
MLKIKKIKPLFTSIVTTGDKFEHDDTQQGIITAKKGDLKLWQKVVAVGSSVRGVAVGDMVMINASHYAVKKYDATSAHEKLDANPILQYVFNWVNMEDENGESKPYLLLDERDVMYAFEGEEVEEKILTQDKPKLIV